MLERWLVQRDFFLLLLPPSRQPVSLPFIPFLAPYARFYGLPRNFAPSLPSSRSMKLVNRFFEGVHVIVVVRFPANVFRRRKKKNKEKKERNRLFEFFKTYYYEVEKYTLRSFRLPFFFVIIVEVISIDSYI